MLKEYELPEPKSLDGSRVQNSSASVIPRKGARVKSEESDLNLWIIPRRGATVKSEESDQVSG